MEQTQIAWALEQTGDNQSQAARLLGTSREKLRYRMRKYGIRTGRDGASYTGGASHTGGDVHIQPLDPK